MYSYVYPINVDTTHAYIYMSILIVVSNTYNFWDLKSITKWILLCLAIFVRLSISNLYILSPANLLALSIVSTSFIYE